MKCPICNAVFEGKKVCPECGTDIVLYKKVCGISSRLYNDALEKSLMGDYYNAEKLLNKSVLFNKGNIDARNLLGLVCYETGKIGLALKHWIISYNMKKEDNPAKDYIKDFEENPKMIEKFNNSVKYYNQGLKFLQQDSDDMAVIHLRKAVDTNLKFIEALNLLTLAYIMQNKEEKAIETIKNVLSIDIANPTAMAYFKHLKPDKTRPDEDIKIGGVIGRSQSSTTFNKTHYSAPLGNNIKNSGNSKWIEILAFLVGCICTAAVMYILIIPNEVQEGEKKVEIVSAELSELKHKYDNDITYSRGEIEGLKNENAELKKQNDEFNKQLNVQNIIAQIDNAQTLSKSGDNAQAAVVLAAIDVSSIPAEKLEQYNSIKKQIYSSESARFLNEGKKLFNSKNYDEAKVALENCLKYSEETELNKYSAMYYLGKAYKETGDSEKAKEYLNQVVENHPQKNFQGWAKSELSSL